MSRHDFFVSDIRVSWVSVVICVVIGWTGPPTWADVIVMPTMTAGDLRDGLHATGLTITSVSTPHGAEGQFGTYRNFLTPPIRIGDGVVLSSGNVAFMTPPADPSLDTPQPSYDMTGPGTPEFDAYGPAHITNFQGSYDVAVLQVDFHLEQDSQIKFDVVFGTVEFPFYTSSYTDGFLVFLDGSDAANQITFDHNGKPVQVGDSFAGLESTADLNTAFADPHAVLPRLTTTSAVLAAGDHTILFEVGDVNDGILDSAAFIANLRTGAGTEGTDPSEDIFDDFDRDGHVDAQDFAHFVDCMAGPMLRPTPTPPTTPEACLGAFDFDGDGDVDAADFGAFQREFGIR